MGLAGPKKRVKLSHDPNNTKWTSDTQSFGHKMMAAQGWKPGEYLGVKDAPHAEFHTAANASHIRVMIKDDNLGLGAKVGSGVGHGECTGLDAFKNLLGRLNGKDENELEKEQKSRDDLKRAIYAEQRWGSIRFVKGGFLVGDKIQDLIDDEAERVRKLAAGSDTKARDFSDSDSESGSEIVAEMTKKSKKRISHERENSLEILSTVKRSKSRKLKEQESTPEVFAVKSKKAKKKRKSEVSPDAAIDILAGKGDSKEPSKKRSKRERETEPDLDNDGEVVEIKKRRKEKKNKEHKTEGSTSLDAALRRDLRREEKKKEKMMKKEKRKRDDDPLSAESTRLDSTKGYASATPVSESGRSTPIMMQGRHAVRARNIAQKRLASMDVASLNQIFMIKPQT